MLPETQWQPISPLKPGKIIRKFIWKDKHFKVTSFKIKNNRKTGPPDIMYNVTVILKEWHHSRYRWRDQWSRIDDQEACILIF